MPHLEAPACLVESSPETSLSAELAAPAPAPAAVQELHYAHIPEFRVEVPRLPVARRILPRINSFDRDIPIAEEDNHFPAFVHLMPVVLPPQVTESLDELLRRVTERSDLQNVEAVRLRVISYTISLSRLALFLPRLQQLDLSGSVLSSLRDLGCGLIQLSHLNVSNCGLNSFDGTSGLPALRVLIADSNMIQRVGPLAELSLLQRLSARHNRISELSLLTFLGMCPNLLELDLHGNPVCHLALYRVTIQRSVHTLELLDGVPLHQSLPATGAAAADVIERSHSSTDGDLSSLSSEVYSEAMTDSTAESLDTDDAPLRPATAPVEPNGSRILLSLNPHRPASVADDAQGDTLTLGTPVVGSALGWARRYRRRRHSGQAWAASISSDSISTSSTRPPSVSSNSSAEHQPPNVALLPPLQTELPEH